VIPHRFCRDAQHAFHARAHFIGSLVGKRHGENIERRDAFLLNQPGNAMNQDTCFAAACASED
jgi:hypothetical protein